jgi:hypothetical protein
VITLGILSDSWKEYQSKVLDPVGAGALQRKETRIAFYMGAMCLLDGVLKRLSPSEGEPTPEDYKLLDDVRLEMEAFTKTMLERRV